MRLDNGAYFVVLKVGAAAEKPEGGEQVILFNPRMPEANLFAVSRTKFFDHWTGEIILLKRIYQLADTDAASACPGSCRNSGASAPCCAMW